MEASSTRLETPHAVLAAGAWSSEIEVEGQSLPRAFPVRGHLVGYALEPHSLGPILRRGHTYLLQRSGGFTIAGTSSEEVGFDRTLNPVLVSDIHSRAAALLPRLAAGRGVAGISTGGQRRRSRSSAGLAEWLSGWPMVTTATEF